MAPILHKARKLKLKRRNPHNTSKGKSPHWTSEQDEVVRRFYNGEMDVHEPSEPTGRPPSPIYNRGSKILKLKKERT